MDAFWEKHAKIAHRLRIMKLDAAIALDIVHRWVTEAIPIAATALFPVVLLPLTGISGATAAAAPYANPNVFLFLGGFIVAKCIERQNLHRRLALIPWASISRGCIPGVRPAVRIPCAQASRLPRPQLPALYMCPSI